MPSPFPKANTGIVAGKPLNNRPAYEGCRETWGSRMTVGVPGVRGRLSSPWRVGIIRHQERIQLQLQRGSKPPWWPSLSLAQPVFVRLQQQAGWLAGFSSTYRPAAHASDGFKSMQSVQLCWHDSNSGNIGGFTTWLCSAVAAWGSIWSIPAACLGRGNAYGQQ